MPSHLETSAFMFTFVISSMPKRLEVPCDGWLSYLKTRVSEVLPQGKRQEYLAVTSPPKPCGQPRAPVW